MSTLETLTATLDRYREVAFDLLRIYLGIGLLVRGGLFAASPSTYLALVPPDVTWLTSPVMIYTIAVIHLVGGLLLTVGMFTRIAALAQIPILFGAVIVAQMQGGLFAPTQSFEFSALVLFLLVLVFLCGCDDWAIDTHTERSPLFPGIQGRQDTFREAGYTLLRGYLGVGLLVRGLLFISNSSAYLDLVPAEAGGWLASTVLLHYVALAHITGGTLMALGLLTRVGALIQMPILAGAVFIAPFQGGLFTASQSFEFAMLVLFLLAFVFLYGSGRWSVDQYVFDRNREQERDAATRSPTAEAILNREDAGVLVGSEYEGDGAAIQEQTQTLTCPRWGSCPVTEAEVPHEHEWISPQAHYSGLGWFLFIVDVTPEPKEVSFQCSRCGQTIGRSQAQEDLEQHRYH
jgi:uncharacterized membrane protein YphA (DoxX/SURF4 family)